MSANWPSIIGDVFKVLLMLFSWLLDRDKERKELKRKYLEEGLIAVKKKDRSGISLAFSRFNRLRKEKREEEEEK